MTDPGSAHDDFSLTVITPTFDRADRLPALYESLLRQPDPRVEWLIVDDGSTDGTADLVRRWIDAGRMRIRLLVKPNGGKHTALNVGIPTITSRLTIIVDSDDHLTDDALATIERYERTWGARRSSICGFAFTRISPAGGSLLARPLPEAEFVASYLDARVNSGLDGDMAEVFYTERLRAFPFPEFAGEQFIAEDVVLIRMGLTCPLVFVDRPIYVCEYLPGGLTRAGRAKAVRSPRGSMVRGRLLMDRRFRLAVRLKGAVLFVACGRFAGVSVRELLGSSGHPWLTLLGLAPGAVLHRRWRGLAG